MTYATMEYIQDRIEAFEKEKKEEGYKSALIMLINKSYSDGFEDGYNEEND